MKRVFAVKVAGMRVVQNKPPHEKPVAEPVKTESGEGDEGEKSTAVEVEKKPKEKLLVSGVAAKVWDVTVIRFNFD